MKKTILSPKDYSILVANAIIHFETALYGFLVPILAPLFFPSSDPIVSLILAYSVFATSMITQPIGSYIFGSLAMSIGPGQSLIYSLLGVGFFTLSIGLLPTYDQIGYYAPFLLVLLRMLRGLFTAGERAIAKFHIIDGKPDKLAVRSSYLYQTSSMIGLVVASFASTTIITLETEYLWRACYIIGGLVGLTGFFLRKFQNQIDKAVSRKGLRHFTTQPLIAVWQRRNIVLKISIVYAFSHITYSTPFILLNALVPEITDLTLASMMQVNTGLLIFDLVMLPVIGVFVEKYDASSIMGFAALILALTIMPMWYFLGDASFWYVLFLRGWIVFWGVLFACPFNHWCNKQIASDDKYVIYGAASTFGAGFLGKANPAICLFIYHALGHYMWISVYLAAVMMLTGVVVKWGSFSSRT